MSFQVLISSASHALASSSDLFGTILKFCFLNASTTDGACRRLDRSLEDRLQYVLRRTGRREQPLPCDRADAGISDLLHRRHVGKFGQTLVVHQRERPQLAGFDLGRGRRDVEERGLGVAGDHVVDHAGRAVLVVNGDHIEIARLLGEEGHVIVRIAAGADRAVAQLARILLGVLDQLGNALDVEVGGGHDQEFGNIDDAGDCHDVLVVIRQLRRRQHGRDRIGGHVADHQRVAIRLGIDHFIDGDDAVGAGLVLDHEGLSGDLPQLVAEDAGHDVGCAAGSIGHDDLHRLRRIFVLRRSRDGAERDAQQRQTKTDPSHRCLPMNSLFYRRPTRGGRLPTDCSPGPAAETGKPAARSCRPVASAQTLWSCSGTGAGSSGFRVRPGQAALMPWRLWEASLQVKNTTSASGVALPECTTFEGT